MKAYQMKIMIKNSHPPIWRRCIVPAGLTFSQLSFLLNEIMGWFGNHLSMFEFYHLGIVLEDDPERLQWGNRKIMDAINTPIEPFMDTENWFTYIYDLGDYWEHRVEIEKVLSEYEYDYPMVLKYKGDTPYEDCGGIYGYYEKIEILENPKDPRYEEIKEWLDALPHITYDTDEVNEILKKYPLSEKTHAPMSRIEIYESCWNGEPLYTIADVFDKKPEREEALLAE